MDPPVESSSAQLLESDGPHAPSPDEPRAIKRSRQACDVCRRRKTRCSGDRPICEFCKKSGQDCVWTTETLNESRHFESDVALAESSQFQQLQGTVNEILNLVRTAQINGYAAPAAATPSSQRQPVADVNPFSRSQVASAIDLFETYCLCQPFPLVTKNELWSAYDADHDELIHAIIALTAPFRYLVNSTSAREARREADRHREAAKASMMRRVSDGTVELATIQAMIVSSYLNLECGYSHRARLECDLAASLAQSLSVASTSRIIRPERPHGIENSFHRLHWCLFVLECLVTPEDRRFPGRKSSPQPPYPDEYAPLPASVPHTSAQQGPHLNFVAQGSGNMEDAGIVAYSIQSHELMAMAAVYGVNSQEKESIPPWATGSDYSDVMASALNLDSSLHAVHRFVTARFEDRSLRELEGNRHYWSSWLLVQFAFHTTRCMLNHPVLLSARLKNFHGIIPQQFIETSFDQARIHIDWIIHFVQMIERKGYQVSDPLLGHCVAIAATICLQHGQAELVEVREKANRCYSTCLSWLSTLSSIWPSVGNMLKKLKHLERDFFNSSESSSDRQMNLSLLLELINYRTASESSQSLDQLYGPSLAARGRFSNPRSLGDFRPSGSIRSEGWRPGSHGSATESAVDLPPFHFQSPESTITTPSMFPL